MNKQVLTTGDVAKYCGVNFRTVIRWIKKGHLKAYQLPGRGDNRIGVQDFFTFLKQHHIQIPQEFQQANGRILVVDDEPAMANSIQRILRQSAFETQVASDGFKAGVLLGTFQPSLMTLDLSMPGLGGLEVIQYVRRNPALHHVKILVVSAMPEADLNKARVAGADDVLEKPFTNEALMEKVLRLMGSRELPQAAP